MADATDSEAVIPHHLGELDDVDSAVAPINDKAGLWWNLAGSEWRVREPAAAIAQIATANATDLATAEALANANKAKINTILTTLAAQGVILP